MIFDVITIFPEMIRAALGHSILKRAQEAGLIQTGVHDLRDWSPDKHRSTDDTPYGGGAGMVMTPGPWFSAVESLRLQPGARVVLLSPQGAPLTQPGARALAEASRIVLLCGHYEGFDERVRQHLATDELSIGDYVLTGGELPALIVIDAVTRLLPGVLGNDQSAQGDTFTDNLLEYPQYTRPTEFRGWRVPEILLSGHHAEIARWRRKEQMRRTRERRPDLWKAFEPSKSDLKVLQELEEDHSSLSGGGGREENP